MSYEKYEIPPEQPARMTEDFAANFNAAMQDFMPKYGKEGVRVEALLDFILQMNMDGVSRVLVNVTSAQNAELIVEEIIHRSGEAARIYFHLNTLKFGDLYKDNQTKKLS